MMDKKQYNKQYYQKHKQQLLDANKKWIKTHPTYSHEYYLKNKEKYSEQCNRWKKNNPKRFVQLCNESRKRRVDRLREQGCTNAWCVVTKGSKPKFKGEDKE